MPLQYTGVLEEHRACRDGAVVFDVSHLGTVECRGPGAYDAAAVAADQRSRTHRARPRAVHAPARSGRRARGRRHHRVVGRRRALRRDAERVEHRSTDAAAAGGRATRWRPRSTRRRHRDAGGARGAGSGGAARCSRRSAPRRPRCRGSRCSEVGDVGSSRAPATPARTGWRSTSPRPSAPALWDAVRRRGHHARRSRRARHAAARGRAPVARSRAGRRASRRCRPGSVGSCGWDKGDFRGRAALDGERERGIARRLRGHLDRGPPPGRAKARPCCSTAQSSAR